MNFSSNVTISIPSEIDMKYWDREEKSRFTKTINELLEALGYTHWKEQYKVWVDYFWSGDYEDYSPDMDLPKFVENYEYFVQKYLQREIRNGLERKSK